MSGLPIREEELHAFIDGELPADRARAVAVAVETDPELATRVAAFAADKAALAAAYGPIGREPLPPGWLARIDRATAPPVRRAVPRRAVIGMALAACLALVLGGVALLARRGPPEGPLVAEAEAARRETTPALARLSGAALADAAARDAALAHAVGLRLRAPDLAHLGWSLTEIDTYKHAAALRYRGNGGATLTLFVRPSAGAPRFDLLRNGPLRICIWQDEVMGTVMMGEMSAGQMMRVAGTAYAALNL